VELARLKSSLSTQTSKDFEHTVITDEIGIGVEKAQLVLRDVAPNLVGDHILIVDDDDFIISDTLVEDVAKVAAVDDPDVIMTYVSYRDESNRLPPESLWGLPPVHGYITVSNFIVKRAVFQANVHLFHEAYAADFTFISGLFKAGVSVFWLPTTTVRIIAANNGR
jgi:hypothetical protein